ncbi:MAG: hypothetical protein OEY44_01440, partial [Candidatus Peregrinibacteria bacterium]|nr:hypothetical protein [Candidatus Peregrinibacteria bacterium]
MHKSFRESIKIGLAIVVLGQLIFALYSPRYLTPSFQGRIYATTGVKHKQEDLHKLNEAAHYFGQTIIGWLKFPSFMSDLSEYVELPPGSFVSAHIQERQNIIFTLSSAESPSFEMLMEIKNFIQ